MRSADATAIDPEGLSALCVACGLCCDGSLFRFLPVEPGDAGAHRALGLPVVKQSGRLAMPLPCAKLEARCCTVYAQRPPGCRAFVCHLGHRLERKEVGFAHALGVVQQAQQRIAALRAAWPGVEPVVQRATAAAQAGELPEAALEALAAVHAWLDEHVHWPDGPVTGT